MFFQEDSWKMAKSEPVSPTSLVPEKRSKSKVGNRRSTDHLMPSLASSSSHLFSALAQRPRMERVLSEALELHAKISGIESKMEEKEKERVLKRQGLQEELSKLEQRKQEIQTTIKNLDKENNKVREDCLKSIQSLRQSSSYMDASSIERLSHDLHQLDLHADQMRRALNEYGKKEDKKDNNNDCEKNDKEINNKLPICNEALLCPVCLTIPSDQVYSCAKCDNMVCGTCLLRLVSCPSCRQTFKNLAPNRNRLAERLIAAQQRQQKRLGQRQLQK